MPDPKDNAKQTGDVHPPEVESTGPAAAEDSEIQDTQGRGDNQSGLLKERKPTVDGRNRDYN
jgi:hypothetical protein